MGLRDLDPGEKAAIKALRIRTFTMRDVDRLGIGAVMDAALAALLARCRSEDQGEARPLGQLMRSIATERDPGCTSGHALLLDALEALLDSMEGDSQ